ncbi:hypothetical protein [Nocardia tengchongensis]
MVDVLGVVESADADRAQAEVDDQPRSGVAGCDVAQQRHSNRRVKHLKLRQSGRISIAALAAVTALSLSACGNGEKKETTKPVKPSTTKIAAAQTYPPAPTAADLNSAMQKVLDPSVPDSETLDLMQGMQADPSLPSRIIEAYNRTMLPSPSPTSPTWATAPSLPTRKQRSTAARRSRQSCRSSLKTADGKFRRTGSAISCR